MNYLHYSFLMNDTLTHLDKLDYFCAKVTNIPTARESGLPKKVWQFSGHSVSMYSSKNLFIKLPKCYGQIMIYLKSNMNLFLLRHRTAFFQVSASQLFLSKEHANHFIGLIVKSSFDWIICSVRLGKIDREFLICCYNIYVFKKQNLHKL